jgi:hypothetical protein
MLHILFPLFLAARSFTPEEQSAAESLLSLQGSSSPLDKDTVVIPPSSSKASSVSSQDKDTVVIPRVDQRKTARKPECGFTGGGHARTGKRKNLRDTQNLLSQKCAALIFNFLSRMDLLCGMTRETIESEIDAIAYIDVKTELLFYLTNARASQELIDHVKTCLKEAHDLCHSTHVIEGIDKCVDDPSLLQSDKERSKDAKRAFRCRLINYLRVIEISVLSSLLSRDNTSQEGKWDMVKNDVLQEGKKTSTFSIVSNIIFSHM